MVVSGTNLHTHPGSLPCLSVTSHYCSTVGKGIIYSYVPANCLISTMVCTLTKSETFNEQYNLFLTKICRFCSSLIKNMTACPFPPPTVVNHPFCFIWGKEEEQDTVSKNAVLPFLHFICSTEIKAEWSLQS